MINIEEGNRILDLESLFFRDNVVFLGTDIDDAVVNRLILQLLYLQRKPKVNKITMIINSSGGSVYDGMAVLDTMDFLKSRNITVETFCVGKAASMAGVILAHGTFGSRKILKNSMVMLHQPLMSVNSRVFKQTDIDIEAKQMSLIRNTLERIICEDTGHDIQQVNKLLDKDYFLSPEEAKNFGTKGIVDEISGLI